LVGNAEVRRPLGRSGRRWEDDIKINFRERGWEGMAWTDVSEDRDRRRAVVKR
jgi:hypothetical protein